MGIYRTVVFQYIFLEYFKRELGKVTVCPSMIGNFMPLFRHFLQLRPRHTGGIFYVPLILIHFGAVNEKCSAKAPLFQLRSRQCIMLCQPVIESVTDGTNFIVPVLGDRYIPIRSGMRNLNKKIRIKG